MYSKNKFTEPQILSKQIKSPSLWWKCFFDLLYQTVVLSFVLILKNSISYGIKYIVNSWHKRIIMD